MIPPQFSSNSSKEGLRLAQAGPGLFTDHTDICYFLLLTKREQTSGLDAAAGNSIESCNISTMSIFYCTYCYSNRYW